MRLPLSEIPPVVIEQYDLARMAHNGWVYVRIVKGMPGLKQAGRIANDRLVKHLARFDFAPVRHTPSLWKHSTRPI